ncbi:MAG: hypothetical protein NZ811_05300 [Gammaproteobacteria bacterium]|nr:hypothetical protein [Gammaproteobacteria bacterium]
MMKNKVTVSDVNYSNRSETLSFTITTDLEAMRMIKDIIFDHSAEPHTVAESMGEILSRAIVTDYYRGGLRIRANNV